jgi:hypothetical protein
MHFRDLMRLSFDEKSRAIDLAAIHAALPDTPEAVSRQVYSDHGRNIEFQISFGSIDIKNLTWQLLTLPASRICAASVSPRFLAWIETVRNRMGSFDQDGWNCIDTRCDVVRSWSTNATWLSAPVFFIGAVVGSASELYLVEGHTRIGVLSGVLKRGIVSPHSTHSVWVGFNLVSSPKALVRRPLDAG